MFGTDVCVEIVLIVSHIGTVIAEELALLRMISSEVFGQGNLSARAVLTLGTLVRLTSPLRYFLHLPLTLLMLHTLITELTPATLQRESLARVMRPPVPVERLPVVTPVGAARTGADQSQFPHVNPLLMSF